MNSQRIAGIALLVGGAVLLFFGFQASESLGDQMHESFTGRFTDNTVWMFIIGAIVMAAGAAMTFLKR